MVWSCQVYDGDAVVCVKEGCGHCVLPALTLKPHPPTEEGESCKPVSEFVSE